MAAIVVPIGKDGVAGAAGKVVETPEPVPELNFPSSPPHAPLARIRAVGPATRSHRRRVCMLISPLVEAR
jgi:hypothetical protein